jgi:hypothetical protein
MAVVVGIFRDYEQAQASVRDLIASGFSSEAISVVSRQDPARAAEALPDPAPPEADTSGAAIGWARALSSAVPSRRWASPSPVSVRSSPLGRWLPLSLARPSAPPPAA